MKLNIIFIVDYLHFKDLLKYKCELYMRQSLTSSQYKIFVTYYVSNHRLVIKAGRWSTIPFSRDKGCVIFALDVVENEVHFVLECPLYNSMRDKFQSLIWECQNHLVSDNTCNTVNL